MEIPDSAADPGSVSCGSRVRAALGGSRVRSQRSTATPALCVEIQKALCWRDRSVTIARLIEILIDLC